MKSASKSRCKALGARFQARQRLKIFCAIALLLIPAVTFAAVESDRLFETVTLNDGTYSQLQKLAQAGLLSKDEAAYPLTRYDVARRLLKAREKAGEIVVAQADMEIPPPPEGEISPSASTGSDELMAPGDASASAPKQTDAEAIAGALKTLHSLEEAYKWEVDRVKGKLKAVQTKANEVDSQQYDLRKRLKGMEQFPKVAVHGLGRYFAYSYQLSGNLTGVSYYPTTRGNYGYLDLGPEGTISKEISWRGVFRIQSSFTPSDNPILTVRQVTMNFDPPWMSAQVGDFWESYTPLTLWSRDDRDLGFVPEYWDRHDEMFFRYEREFDHGPAWPFRGLRLSTALMWPDAGVLEEVHASIFAHMIRNGFDDGGSSGGWYFGANIFTDWVWSGKVGLRTQKAYLGGTSVQFALDAYGSILDEPLDTTLPGSSYLQFNPATWAQQYLSGSVKPDLKVGFGGDFYAGGTLEYALTRFQDDKNSSGRVSDDFALLGGPYFQWGSSKLVLNYLNVGPYYYSPLAQTRQDKSTNRIFLVDVPRAGGIFGLYDRAEDNTFPYGLATPNRQGFGGELDVKALEKDSLKIKASAYFLQEISGNLVVNSGGSGFVPVDTVPSSLLVPVRNFTYVNVGPSFNLGPHIGLETDLEFGVNVRMEQTSSVLGNLNSIWIIGGVRVEILPVWEVGFSYSHFGSNGTEAGLLGTTLARYSYLYDNTDLGSYGPVTVDGTYKVLALSNNIKVNRNSTIFLEYQWDTGYKIPLGSTQGTQDQQYLGLIYEVQF